VWLVANLWCRWGWWGARELSAVPRLRGKRQRAGRDRAPRRVACRESVVPLGLV